jgi:hypothetical protein
MDQRISRTVALAAAVTLLAGCGSGSASGGSDPTVQAPTLAQAPASSDVDSPEAAASDPSSPTADTAAQTKQVQAVTEKFVTSVLTIGYPDKSFDAYLDRIRPQMTERGFDSLESAESTKKGTAALKSLYPQRSRSAPRFNGDPQVTSLEATSASAQLDYENVAQRKEGDDWKTLKSVGTGSVTVKLVLSGGKWLVDDAS